MKGKVEDKLVQLAFGDLSPSEAKRLEQVAERDPEAHRALVVYKEMRDGLRLLADVPEDQFSKERLRDAILKEGLKPAPYRPTSNRAWLWMPVAACAIGFGFVFVRRTMVTVKSEPQVVMSSKSLRPTPLVEIKEPIRVAVNTAPTAASFVGPAQPKLREVSDLGSRHGNRHRLEPNEVDPAIFARIPDGGEFEDALGTAVLEDDTPTPTTAPHNDTVTAASGPMVMIDPDKDASTGAQRAREVGSSSNVLVSG